MVEFWEPLRKKRRPPNFNNRKCFNPPDKETLHRLYVVERKSYDEIGALYGLKGSYMKDLLIDAGVHRKALHPKKPPYLNKEDVALFREMVEIKKYTLEQCATHFNVTANHLSWLCEKYHIKRQRMPSKHAKHLIYYNQICKKYLSGASISELSEEFGMSKLYVYIILYRLNVKKKKSYADRTKTKEYFEKHKKAIIDAYLSGTSIYRLAKTYKRDKFHIRKFLKTQNVYKEKK